MSVISNEPEDEVGENWGYNGETHRIDIKKGRDKYTKRRKGRRG